MRFNSLALLTIMGSAFFPTITWERAYGDDWPQWRGPQRDGIWRETGVVDSIPESGMPVRWRTRILNGWSGPAVASGRVFVTDHNYKSKPELERVLCFDERTGKQLWLHEYPCPYGNMEYGNGPRATPTVHEGLVYTLGTMGHLVCLDAETGALMWKKDPVRDLNVKMPRYGVSAAPLIEGDVVIISAGARPAGTAIAFDRKTGTELWRALDDRPAYSAPIVLEMAGKRQVILWTGDNVNSLDPATGELLWQVPFKASFDPAQATATPVTRRQNALACGVESRLNDAQVEPREARSDRILEDSVESNGVNQHTRVSARKIHLHHCWRWFAVLPRCGDRRCDLSTRAATSERFGMAHIVTNGERCFLLNQQGHLILARLTPDGYREAGRMPLIEPTAGYRAAGPVCWAHPAFANKHVFARNDRELVCVSLAADAVTTSLAAATSDLDRRLCPKPPRPNCIKHSPLPCRPREARWRSAQDGDW